MASKALASRKSRRSFAFLFGLSLALVASTSFAAPTMAQREEARRKMDEGRSSAKAGDHQRALEAFSAAHDLMHVPTTGLAVAKEQAALGRLVEARATARDVLAMPRQEKEPPVFGEARQAAKDLETELFGRIPTLALTIQGGRATRVTVDGAAILEAQLADPIPLNPGSHVVVVKGGDDTEKHVDVDLKEGDVRKLTVDLPSPEPRKLVVGDGPSTPAEDEGGRSGASKALIYGGFGLAVVGAAVGAVTGVMTLSKAKTLSPKCEDKICAPEVQSELDGANTLATVSTIGFAAAGAGLVLGVIGLAMPSSTPDDKQEGSLSIRIGLGHAAIGGRF